MLTKLKGLLSHWFLPKPSPVTKPVTKPVTSRTERGRAGGIAKAKKARMVKVRLKAEADLCEQSPRRYASKAEQFYYACRKPGKCGWVGGFLKLCEPCARGLTDRNWEAWAGPYYPVEIEDEANLELDLGAKYIPFWLSRRAQ